MAKAKLTVVKPAQRTASVPEHLGAAGRVLWGDIQSAYQIADPGGLALLQQAAEAADRIASVRKQIDEAGELIMVRGIPRVNPLCAVERDQRAALVRCLRNLNLDVEPLRDRPGRPEGMRWHGKEQW
jgi:hypothetical protein